MNVQLNTRTNTGVVSSVRIRIAEISTSHQKGRKRDDLLHMKSMLTQHTRRDAMRVSFQDLLFEPSAGQEGFKVARERTKNQG